MENKFKLDVGGDRSITSGLTKEILITLIKQVEKVEVDYIVLMPKIPIKGTDFLQYATDVELHFISDGNGKLYSYTPNNVEEVIAIFLDYYDANELPNTDNWEDITSILQENMFSKLIRKLKRILHKEN